MADEENINGLNNYNGGIEDEDVGRRFVKKKRRERLVRKGRMKQERSRSFTRFVICSLLILGFAYLLKCDGWYLDKDAFNKFDGQTVEIINNKIVPTKKIQVILHQLEVSDLPIYMMKTSQIKKELMQLKPIDNVYIRRYAFPARLQIIVRERIPLITIAPDAQAPATAFFTTDGTLIGREFLPLNPAYKTILVLSYGNKADDYPKWDMKKYQRYKK